MFRPLVAIVGRPNVGKSTLFNRLLGEPRAVVEDIPGTTRDRIYADLSWGGRELTLIDTGGLEVRPSSDMAQRVKDQVEVALDEADVILFLGDGVDGVMLPDREVAEVLRRSSKPVVLAVSKADNERRRAQALEFYELAMGDPIPVSAQHGLGLEELMERVLELLPPPLPSTPEPEVMKVAIVGRPNVGKSLLLNALLGQERAIVDDTPGTTRDALDTLCPFDGQAALLIDTAGLRRRGRVERGVEQYSVLRALRAIARADVALLVVEATDPMTAQDAHIAGYIHQAFKGMVVVVNKWDLAGELGLEREECLQLVRQRLKFWPGVPILLVSALRGQGTGQVLPSAREVYQERTKRLPTSMLNRYVQEAVSSHAPPAVGGHRLHILYATQAQVNPPTFVFFVNDPKLLHFSYQRYLENRLRAAFGFTGTSLRLIFRRREGGER